MSSLEMRSTVNGSQLCLDVSIITGIRTSLRIGINSLNVCQNLTFVDTLYFTNLHVLGFNGLQILCKNIGVHRLDNQSHAQVTRHENQGIHLALTIGRNWKIKKTNTTRGIAVVISCKINVCPLWCTMFSHTPHAYVTYILSIIITD